MTRRARPRLRLASGSASASGAALRSFLASLCPGVAQQSGALTLSPVHPVNAIITSSAIHIKIPPRREVIDQAMTRNFVAAQAAATWL